MTFLKDTLFGQAAFLTLLFYMAGLFCFTAAAQDKDYYQAGKNIPNPSFSRLEQFIAPDEVIGEDFFVLRGEITGREFEILNVKTADGVRQVDIDDLLLEDDQEVLNLFEPGKRVVIYGDFGEEFLETDVIENPDGLVIGSRAGIIQLED